MPNGKPGDHPLTDSFAHRIEVYGPEADALIRKIGELCGGRESNTWWEHEIAGHLTKKLFYGKRE